MLPKLLTAWTTRLLRPPDCPGSRIARLTGCHHVTIVSGSQRLPARHVLRRSLRPHADDAPVPEHQGRTSGCAAFLPDGRLLRDVLRGCPKGGSAAVDHTDQAWHVGRRANPDGRGTRAGAGAVPSAVGGAGPVGGHLRADWRSGRQQGARGAEGDPHHHPRHADGRATAARTRGPAAGGAGVLRRRAARCPDYTAGHAGHRGGRQRALHAHHPARGRAGSRDRADRPRRAAGVRGGGTQQVGAAGASAPACPHHAGDAHPGQAGLAVRRGACRSHHLRGPGHPDAARHRAAGGRGRPGRHRCAAGLSGSEHRPALPAPAAHRARAARGAHHHRPGGTPKSGTGTPAAGGTGADAAVADGCLRHRGRQPAAAPMAAGTAAGPHRRARSPGAGGAAAGKGHGTAHRAAALAGGRHRADCVAHHAGQRTAARAGGAARQPAGPGCLRLAAAGPAGCSGR